MKEIVIAISEKEYLLAEELVAAALNNIKAQAGGITGRSVVITGIRNAFISIVSMTIKSMCDAKKQKKDIAYLLMEVFESLNDFEMIKLIDAIYAGKDFTDEYTRKNI